MRTRRRSSGRRDRAGFTLLEVAVSAAVMLVLAIGVSESVRSMGRLASARSVDARLQDEAQRALVSILADLRRSGFATIDGQGYPHIFVDGDAGAGFDAHDHAAANEHAEAGEPGFGPNREIVLRLPRFRTVMQDDGGVNWDPNDAGVPHASVVKTYEVPEVGGDGRLLWAGEDLSYVLVTDASGTNLLQRRVVGGRTLVAARDVERVTFEGAAEAPAEVPVNAIRVRLWLRARDERGAIHRHLVEALSDLRNGDV